MLCDTCVNAGTASYKYPCNRCDMIEGSSRCKYEKVRTNADRIRAMSDKEMAKFLYTEFLDEEGSKSRITEWLKQPAE